MNLLRPHPSNLTPIQDDPADTALKLIDKSTRRLRERERGGAAGDRAAAGAVAKGWAWAWAWAWAWIRTT